MADAGSPVSKSGTNWQLALVVGLPVAVGVGYWYFCSRRKKEKVKKLEDKNKSELREIFAKGETLTKTKKEPISKTPLELAIELKEEGNKWFKNSNFNEALSSYEKAIKICPENESISLATFYQNKAAAYEQLQKYEDAKEACTKALALNPKYTKALLRRAKICEHTKDLTQALEDLITACILENFQSQSTIITADRILKELGLLHAKEAMAKRIPVMPSKSFIKSYFVSFSNDPINAFLTKREDGDNLKGFLKAVDCFIKEDYDSIIPACTEEINLTEAEALYKNEALVLRGTFYQFTGQNNLALADLDIVINNEEASTKLKANALIKRATINIKLEDPQSSLNDFNAAVILDQHNSDIYHHRGQFNLLMERLKEATDDFKLAVELNPKNPITIVQKYYAEFTVAFFAKNLNAINDIMQKFEDVLKQYPECSECYTIYAQIFNDQQEYEKADEMFQKAIKVDPKNAVLLVRRAILNLQWTGDTDTSVKYINEALTLDSKCELAYETLGTIEVQRNNLTKAIEMFDKAILLTKTETEMAHVFSLKDAAIAQKAVTEKMNKKPPKDIFNQ